MVLPGTNIFSPEGRIGYIKYWIDKLENLNKEANSLPLESTGNLSRDLKQIRKKLFNLSFIAVSESINERFLVTSGCWENIP